MKHLIVFLLLLIYPGCGHHNSVLLAVPFSHPELLAQYYYNIVS